MPSSTSAILTFTCNGMAAYPPAFHDDECLMEEDSQIKRLPVCAGGQEIDELLHDLQTLLSLAHLAIL